jgi:hypothetical protein
MTDVPNSPAPESQAAADASAGPATTPMQRLLMDRAREHAARDAVKPPKRIVLMVVGFALALVVVLTIGTGFDRFLTGVQRFMHIYDEQDRQEEVRRAKQPMPAFVVPGDDAAPAASPGAPPAAPPSSPPQAPPR